MRYRVSFGTGLPGAVINVIKVYMANSPMDAVDQARRFIDAICRGEYGADSVIMTKLFKKPDTHVLHVEEF